MIRHHIATHSRVSYILHIFFS